MQLDRTNYLAAILSYFNSYLTASRRRDKQLRTVTGNGIWTRFKLWMDNRQRRAT